MAINEHTRELVLEALSTDRERGLTRDEILSLIGKDLSDFELSGQRKAVSQVLRYLVGSALVDERLSSRRGHSSRFCLRPEPGSPPSPNGLRKPEFRVKEDWVDPRANAGQAQPLPPFQQKRKGKRVTVYSSPATFDDAVAIEAFDGSRWIRQPLFVNSRVCTGPETPMWHPDQETYRGFERIRIIRANGESVEFGNTTLTIAPDESEE